MKILMLLTVFLLIVSCDQSEPPPLSNLKQENAPVTAPVAPQAQPQSSGILEHMAGAAVAGAAAGSAGAVAHNMTNRAMDNISKRRRAARIAKMRSRRR